MRLPHQVMEEGRQRLARLLPFVLPLAHKQAAREARGLSPRTLLGQSLAKRLHLRNFHALTIYQDHTGLWHVALHISGMPPGIPKAIIAPQDQEIFTQRAAEAAAQQILMQALVEARHNETAGRDIPLKDERIFRLGELEFAISGDLVDRLSHTGSRKHCAILGQRYLDAAISKLSSSGSLTTSSWALAPADVRMEAYKGMALLLTSGKAHHPLPGPSISPSAR